MTNKQAREPDESAAEAAQTRGQATARRLVPLYLGTSAVAATGMVSAITISAIAAEQMLESPTLTGLPMAAAILGTALGSHLVGRRLEQASLRSVLATQYGLGLLGGLLALVAVTKGAFAWLVLGLATVGVGHGATQYMRYLAADVVQGARKAQVLSWAVWTAGIGAVLGPSLLAPTGRIARALGLSDISGPYLLAIAAFALCSLSLGAALPRGKRAAALAAEGSETQSAQDQCHARLRWSPAARLAVFAMVVGHVTMVFVMTMTPIHLAQHGHGLGAVGVVISAHMAGMYLCAPAIGWAVGRWGAWVVMVFGGLVLATATLLAALWSSQHQTGAGAASAPSMTIPLFLLGLGWNCGFVAGSALLNGAFSAGQRLRGRGVADAAVWSAAATASFSSSLLFARIGFVQLNWVALALSLILVATLIAFRKAAVKGN